MKTIDKNCYKKVKQNKQRQVMAEMGTSAFVDKKSKNDIAMHRAKSIKLI